MIVFIDSSVWFAAAYATDRNNTPAKAILRRERNRITSNLVLLETWRLIAHRIHWSAAEEFWDKIVTGGAELEIVTAQDLEAARGMGKRFSDQEFSLTDRTSFSIMERLGIARAASFDRHFSVYRFGRNLSRAFDVVSA